MHTDTEHTYNITNTAWFPWHPNHGYIKSSTFSPHVGKNCHDVNSKNKNVFSTNWSLLFSDFLKKNFVIRTKFKGNLISLRFEMLSDGCA